MISSTTRSDHLLASMSTWWQIYTALYEAGNEQGASNAARRFGELEQEWKAACAS